MNCLAHSIVYDAVCRCHLVGIEHFQTLNLSVSWSWTLQPLELLEVNVCWLEATIAIWMDYGTAWKSLSDNSNISFLSTFWYLFLFNSQFSMFLVFWILCYKTLQHIQNIWYYLFFSDPVVTKEVGECHFIIARCGIKVQVSHSASVDTNWGKGLFIIQCQSRSSGFPLDLHG